MLIHNLLPIPKPQEADFPCEYRYHGKILWLALMDTIDGGLWGDLCFFMEASPE